MSDLVRNPEDRFCNDTVKFLAAMHISEELQMSKESDQRIHNNEFLYLKESNRNE